ncbi:MAG: AAA family ATPase [Deltaproteobacteria bacterium]|nr:AAA family ATPase [Deltaproteobacteria bacterium]
MYISKLSVRNWRNFRQAEVFTKETMYLLGPNASGKSNFLDIFRFIRDIVNPKGGGLQQAVAARGGLTKIRCLAARQKPSVEIVIELNETLEDGTACAQWKYVISIKNEGSGKRRPVVEKEQVFKNGNMILNRPDPDDNVDPERLTQTHLEQINMNKDFRDIASFFENVLYLHLVPQLLKFGDQIAAKRLEADPFGQGFLEEISGTPKKTRESRIKRIEKILKTVIPAFEGLRFLKDDKTGMPHLEMLYVHWRPNAGWQREDQFSDGTLRLIALIWTLLTSNNLILLEEPELSLHKKIVEQIPSLIYQTRKSRKKSGGQIFISTHSEALLSSQSIDGNFAILRPGEGGESANISAPTEDDLNAIRAGMSPADILLPQTSESVGTI